MSLFDCCQKRTSMVSRKSQPLATMPCSRGSLPVSSVAWAVQVTAGSTSGMFATQPSFAIAESRGANGRSRCVRPTQFKSRMGAGIIEKITTEHTEKHRGVTEEVNWDYLLCESL